jgi:hypothetical protein
MESTPDTKHSPTSRNGSSPTYNREEVAASIGGDGTGSSGEKGGQVCDHSLYCPVSLMPEVLPAGAALNFVRINHSGSLMYLSKMVRRLLQLSKIYAFETSFR